jgi:hypothetical protein
VNALFTYHHRESFDVSYTNNFRIFILHSSQTELVSETVRSWPLLILDLDMHHDSLQSPEVIWTYRCKALSFEGENQTTDSVGNENDLGIVEMLSQFYPCFCEHIKNLSRFLKNSYKIYGHTCRHLLSLKHRNKIRFTLCGFYTRCSTCR